MTNLTNLRFKVFTVNGSLIAAFESKLDALMFIAATKRPNDFYIE